MFARCSFALASLILIPCKGWVCFGFDLALQSGGNGWRSNDPRRPTEHRGWTQLWTRTPRDVLKQAGTKPDASAMQ
jgi:hypothetical protein